MDRTVATDVVAHCAQASGALQAAIAALRTSSDQPDVKEAARRVAMLIHLLGAGILHPIYFEHPDLCPEALHYMTERAPAPGDWL